MLKTYMIIKYLENFFNEALFNAIRNILTQKVSNKLVVI